MKYLEWIEPFGPNNEPVYMRVTEATAIAWVHDYTKNYNEKHNRNIVLTDEQALNEFIILHFATVIDE